jgi:uncharacterized protein (TIGR02246 family)
LNVDRQNRVKLPWRRNVRPLAALLVAGSLIWPGTAGAADEKAHARDEQAIRAAAQQYVEALARGDAKTLAAVWLPDGDIVDEFGRSTPAKDVIEAEVKARENSTVADGGRDVKLAGSTIRFLTADVAIEDGTVDVSVKDRPTARGRFAAVWVRRDGRWRLATLREARATNTVADDLAALDAMVGRWSGTSGNAKFHMTAQWNANHTFLERQLTVMHEGRTIMDGQQRIGIDPLDGRIKSWMHDADGGHGEGIWTRHGDAWVVHAMGVSPEGKRTASTNVYTFDGPDAMTWKSTGGVSDGQKVPDFEIKLKRAVGVE